jgi:hypothetical protein
LAWGEEGHQVVALIAAERLDPQAKNEIASLLDMSDASAAMVKVASWADEIKDSRDETETWHFVDIQIASDGYDAARDCKDDNCVVGQVNKDTAILRDKNQPKAARAEALKFLIHFVGDMHQPMHCADNNDRGGNAVTVVANGRLTNMHRVWDTAVVNAMGTDARKVAAILSPVISPALSAQWASGAPENWVNECFVIAKKQIYEAVPGMIAAKTQIKLDDKYPVSVGPITASQLAKGGVRLAWILNTALDPAAPTAATSSAPAPAH